MGYDCFIGCKDCQVVLDLSTFAWAWELATTRPELEAKADQLMPPNLGIAFRATMVVTFMAEHEGHACVLMTENTSGYYCDFVNAKHINMWGEEHDANEL